MMFRDSKIAYITSVTKMFTFLSSKLVNEKRLEHLENKLNGASSSAIDEKKIYMQYLIKVTFAC